MSIHSRANRRVAFGPACRRALQRFAMGGVFALGTFVVLGIAGGSTPARAEPARPMPVEDGQFPCVSAADADRYLRDFKVDVASFGGKELCRPESETKMLLNAFTLIEKGSFAGSAANVHIRNFVPRDRYYSWMKSQTRGMTRGNDIPFATAYNQWGYFTLQNGWVELASLGRVGTLVHEARHTEGYIHIGCDQGPYEGTSVSGCDESIEYGGSHAVEMEYYARVVLEGQNFHPVYQSMARLMALGRSNMMFNRNPIRTREALVLVEQTGARRPVLVDGAKVLERAGPSLGDGVLKRTSFGASYFYGAQAWAIDLYALAQGEYEMQDDDSYFKLARRTDGALANSIDLEEVDAPVANSWRRFLVDLERDGSLKQYSFGDGEWTRPTSSRVPNAERLVTRLPSGAHGLFVLTRAGEIYPYDLVRNQVGAKLPAAWPTGLVSVSLHQQQLVGLQANGEVVKLVNGAAGEPFAPLSGRAFSEMINAPLYDSFEVR